MDPIQQLKARLEKHPELTFRATPNSVLVDPPSEAGFGVSFHSSPGEFVVHYDGWHEHFDSVEEFAFAYSGESRLAITYRGRIPVKWVVERWSGTEWQADSEVGLLFVPFWRPARIVYRQNPKLLSAR